MKHLHISHIFFILLMLVGLIYRQPLQYGFESLTKSFIQNFDWLVLLVTSFFTIFCLCMAFGRYGKIRLGPQDEMPEFKTISWLAMLFSAGMGIGLVFHGVSEPLYHYHFFMHEWGDNLLVDHSAQMGMRMTLMNWGLHAWAIYGLFALMIGYYGFRHQMPFLPSTPFVAAGTISHSSPWVHIVNFMAIIAVIFGITGTLVQGIQQMGNGLDSLGISFANKQHTYMLILILLTVSYCISAVTGLKRGVQYLSNANMILAILFLIIFISLGPTHFIFQSFTSNIGDYLQHIIGESLSLRHYQLQEKWTHDWPIITFLWWMAWAPFVGVFIARISKGRTIKEFILYVLILPTIFSMLWFSAFGGAGIWVDIFHSDIVTKAVQNDFSTGIFVLLEQFSFSAFMKIMVLLIIFIFIITSADSGVFVLGMFSSDGCLNPSMLQKAFWGVVLFLMTFSVLETGEGIKFIRALAAGGAIPFMFIMLIQTYLFYKKISKEAHD